MSLGVTAQPMYREATSNYTTSTDDKTGFTVFKGKLTVADLEKEPSFGWFRKGMAKYDPDPMPVAILRDKLQSYDLVVFLGTWCEDSHEMIPKFFKVLDKAGYRGSVTMYGVNRAKHTGDGEDQKYDITRVPVVVLLKDGKEAGRITEVVEKSVEDELAGLVRR